MIYKHITTKPFVYVTKKGTRPFAYFTAPSIGIFNNTITISPGHVWAGSSASSTLFGKIIGALKFGIPTKDASLVCSILYKYAGLHDLTKDEVDEIFYDLMKLYNFKFAWFYYTAAKLFGSSFWNKCVESNLIKYGPKPNVGRNGTTKTN
jgi:hypothetical protein